jgi:HPt (histidine-containing phosphotransfer) domain-containing protein
MNCVRTERPVEAAPFDVDDLLTRCLGRIELAERILRTFETNLDRDVEQLEQAVRATDVTEIARLAHRIKGASLAVSARELTNCARSIEVSANAGQLAGIAADLDRLKRECGRFAEVRTSLPIGPAC